MHRRTLLVKEGFLSEEEYTTLRRDEEFLWKVRYGLHLITDRPEERLLFDYQRKLAEMFGYQDSEDRQLGVEKFMQRYYRGRAVDPGAQRRTCCSTSTKPSIAKGQNQAR